MNLSCGKLLFIFLLILVPFVHSAQGAADSTGKFHLALVLSGGGARGLAQIGVLKALDEARIHPDLIVGTSMGAIVAGLYACGYSPDSIKSIVKSVNWNDVFTNSAGRRKLFVSQKFEPVNYLFEMRFDYNFRPILPSSISYGQAFYDYLAPKTILSQYLANQNFDSLTIPLRIVTTDIISGQRVVFSRGNLATAIRASCGVPLAFSPVEFKDMLLMDGGLTANIPVEAARDEGAQFILAINVTSPMWKRDELDNPAHLVDQIVSIGVARQKIKDRQLADFTITPNLEKFVNTDFSRIDSLIDHGHSATWACIDSLRMILSAQSITQSESGPLHVQWVGIDSSLQKRLDMIKTDSSERNYLWGCRSPFRAILNMDGKYFYKASEVACSSGTIYATAKPAIINSVVVSGNTRTSPHIILTASGFNKGDTLSQKILQKGMSSLYSTNLFENVNVDLDSAQNLAIHVEEKKYWRMRMDLRFDEFYLGEGYIEPAYENLFGLGMCGLLHLQYGLRREKYFVELQDNHLFTSNLANNIQIQGYISKENIYTPDTIPRPNDPHPAVVLDQQSLRKTGIIVLVGEELGHSTMLSGGIRLERFDTASVNNRSPFNDVLGLKIGQGLPYLMLRLTMDSMDKFPFPTSGIKEYFTLGGSTRVIGYTSDFLKLNGSVGRFFTIADRNTFFPQVSFAWSSEKLPTVERVLLGGAIPEERSPDISVYDYVPFVGLNARAFPGDVMLLLHLDYRFLIIKSLYLTSGVDWGYAWAQYDWAQNKSQVSSVWNDFSKKAPVGVGIGLAFESLIGPIKFTYGRLLNNFSPLGLKAGDQFYFSAGHDF